MDSSRDAHGRDCDCDLGGDCARSASKREGRPPLLSDALNSVD